MKRLHILLMTVFVSAMGFSQAYPPAGWDADFLNALDKAKEEDKYLLLDFTGSDWCGWCHRLEGEVFSQDEFRTWAEENAVLVFLDFPSGIELSEAQRQQNYILQSFLGVKGYPSIWLIDNDLTPLLVTGYRDGGPSAYIQHLENDRIELQGMDPQDFRNRFQQVLDEYIQPLNL